MKIPEQQNVPPMPPVKPTKKKRTMNDNRDCEMSDDLISREALKKEFDDKCAYECAICKYAKDFAPCKLIDNAPTVLHDNYSEGYQDGVRKVLSERPHGEWMIIDDTEQFIAKCSVCGRIEDSRMIKDYPFCHCGADMRGGVRS